MRKLKKGSQLVIGTPGRICDLIKRRKLNLTRLNYLVLDEADEIMNMGFIEDINFIISKASKSRQTLLFSATIPKSIKSIVKSAAKEPVMVEVMAKPLTESQIKEVKINTTDRRKYDDLLEYINSEDPYMAIVFCRTKNRVRNLTEKLNSEGFNVDEIHGDLSQAKREKALTKFRKLKTRFLIATDVAARGLDIDGITHVINYDEPQRQAEYVHRIGRTGRAKETGTAVTFVVQEDADKKRFRKNKKSNKDNKSQKDKNSRKDTNKKDRKKTAFDKFKKENKKSKKDYRKVEPEVKNETAKRKNKKSNKVRDLLKK